MTTLEQVLNSNGPFAISIDDILMKLPMYADKLNISVIKRSGVVHVDYKAMFHNSDLVGPASDIVLRNGPNILQGDIINAMELINNECYDAKTNTLTLPKPEAFIVKLIRELPGEKKFIIDTDNSYYNSHQTTASTDYVDRLDEDNSHKINIADRYLAFIKKAYALDFSVHKGPSTDLLKQNPPPNVFFETRLEPAKEILKAGKYVILFNTHQNQMHSWDALKLNVKGLDKKRKLVNDVDKYDGTLLLRVNTWEELYNARYASKNN